MSRVILLADDSVTIQKVIELTFMDQDYRVVAVSNGDEALNKLAEVSPDLVIADVHMPGPSGFDVARQSKERRPNVPVLLLVGTFEPFDEAEAEQSGAEAFLKKPFDSQELLRKVEELLAQAEAAPSSAHSAREEEAGEETEEQTAPEAEATPGATFEPEDLTRPPAASDPAPVFGDETVLHPMADQVEAAVEEVSGLDLGESLAAEPPISVEPGEPFDSAPEESGEEPGEETEPAAPVASPTVWPELEARADEPLVTLETPAVEPVLEPEEQEEVLEAASADEEPEAPEPSAAEPEPEVSEISEPEPVAADSAVSNGSLSDADVDRVARRVVELLGENAVRDVAWEVIPDLAEVVIRDRLRQLESEAEQLSD